jgi:hypothetical protein
MRIPTPPASALLALPALLLVGACAAGGASSDSAANADRAQSAGSSSSGASGGTSATAPELAGDQPGRSGSAAKTAVAPMSRAIVATGEVSVRATSLARARSEVLRLTTGWGGLVADEQTESDDRGRVSTSTMTLRVPTPRFAEAMTEIGRLGEVEHTSRNTQDVTTQVIDNRARVRAAERSIRQVERLLDRATQLSDIISIESDLARRQADLDSLQQQEAWLSDQTSMSTINVSLSRPSTSPEPDEASGFLAGLSSGWHALGTATLAVLQVVGATLPFAVLLLVLGVPVWLLVRRVSARSTPGRTP